MIEQQNWHSSLTDLVIIEACERSQRSLDNPGFCLICGHEQGECEPDARNYTCCNCGANQVFGAEELMMALAFFSEKKK